MGAPVVLVVSPLPPCLPVGIRAVSSLPSQGGAGFNLAFSVLPCGPIWPCLPPALAAGRTHTPQQRFCGRPPPACPGPLTSPRCPAGPSTPSSRHLLWEAFLLLPRARAHGYIPVPVALHSCVCYNLCCPHITPALAWSKGRAQGGSVGWAGMEEQRRHRTECSCRCLEEGGGGFRDHQPSHGDTWEVPPSVGQGLAAREPGAKQGPLSLFGGCLQKPVSTPYVPYSPCPPPTHTHTIH